jgi:F-type H+-transporting ATPase subunit a
MAGKSIDPFEHVVDSNHIDIFPTAGLTIHLPEITVFGQPVPIKFMLLITASAILVAVAMIWIGRKMQSGEPPRGRLWNFVEFFLFFVRDKIAIPGIGQHDANKYVPYLTSLFLFIFLMNLAGMIPFLGSPTASIMVTGALALVSFVVIHVSGIGEMGTSKYLKTFIPHIEIEGGTGMQIFAFVLKVGMAALEYLTAFIRAGVLAVRLFANMLAGHTVLFMILFFIALVSDPAYKVAFVAEQSETVQNGMWFLMSIFSVALVTALSLLELFIAGLQAFIFTFLTAVFIGLAKHPPH